MSFITLISDAAFEKDRHNIFCRARAITMYYRKLGEALTLVRVGDITFYVQESPAEIAAKIAECEKGRTRKRRDDQPAERKPQQKRREMASRDEVALVGARLFNYRTALGLTCKHVSADSEIPKATLYDVESAATREPRRRVSKATIDAVKQYLNRAEDEFIRDGSGGSPKTIGLYCCSVAGQIGLIRRHWNGSTWVQMQADDTQNHVIAWQYLGRHAR